MISYILLLILLENMKKAVDATAQLAKKNCTTCASASKEIRNPRNKNPQNHNKLYNNLLITC